MKLLAAMHIGFILISRVIGSTTNDPRNTFPEQVTCAKDGLQPVVIFKKELLSAVKGLGDHPQYGTHYIQLKDRDIFVFFKIEGALDGGFTALWAYAKFKDEVSMLRICKSPF